VVWAKPATAVCALVVDERSRILLGRRARAPREGSWDVLGGFLEEDEDPLDGLRRELREETGLEIEPLEFVGAFADRYGPDGPPTLNLFWTARIVSGTPEAADDVAELRWFEPQALPLGDEVAFPNAEAALAAWRESLPPARSVMLGMFEIQLVVSDLTSMTAFYRDELGLQVSLLDGTRGRTHFRLGDGQLILAREYGEPDASPHWPGLPPPLLVASDRRGPTPVKHGPVHFAFEIAADELVAAGERLRAGGHDVRGPFRWPGGQRSIYVRDPELNVAELIAC
jgi:8-oxo-dGTP diphosphatase